MATSTPSNPPDMQTPLAASIPPDPPPEPSRWPMRLLMLAIVAAFLAGGVWAGTVLINKRATTVKKNVLTAPVQKGDLLVTVTEDGNVESAVNIDIKCGVAGGTSILWIVDDGKDVQKGEKLVELDASALEEQINQQKITYEKARSAMVQAEKAFQVAEISVKEYLEGTYKKELQDAEAQITIALENLRSSH